MAWIELHQAVWTHRKTLEFADLLGVPPVVAVGHLAALWSWAVDSAPTGQLGDIRATILARAAQWTGEDATAFAAAAVQAGYLDETPAGLVLHDWMDYAGRLVAQRAANRDRMRASRAPHVRRTNSEHATHVSDTFEARAEHVQGLPNRTVPDLLPDPDPAAATKARALEDAAASGEESVTAALAGGWETYMGGTLSPPALVELLDATRGGDGRPALAPDVVIAAMREAHDHNARSLAYLRRVLRRAADEGLTTSAAWIADQAARPRASPSPRAKPEGPREDATVAGYRDAASRKAARQRTEVPG